jgi:RNA polymerase sigma factor (sigma-70 family)
MNELSDQQLLRNYAERRQETAFAELVHRHVNLVYSAALRMVHDSHQAQDVTQGVFVALAANAPRLANHPVLSGWLHCTARNLAANTVRAAVRRQIREQEAAAMSEPLPTDEPAWAAVAPQLDAALEELNEADREALLLRYFERKSAPEIARLLGVSGEAAQKRVSRALERLRAGLTRRGAAASAGGLAAVLVVNAVQAAPAALTGNICTAALAGATVSTSAIFTATKTIAMTTLQKTLVTITVAALAGVSGYEAFHAADLNQQIQTARREQAPLTQQIQQLQSERDEATQALAQLRAENRRLNQNQSELLELRGKAARLLQQTAAETANTSPRPLAEDPGRELGLAVVRGDLAALEKISVLAKAELTDFNTNSPGLDDTQRSELSGRTFAALASAFQVIEAAAMQGNQNAIDAVLKSAPLPELQGNAVQAIGALAGNGNNDALAVLLNYDKYGFTLSSTVGALQTTAGNGNQQAIDFLSAVTKDENDAALWYMAASGLAKAAESGNPAAIDALAGLAANTEPNVRKVVVAGLRGAATKQNAKALATLQAMGVQ